MLREWRSEKCDDVCDFFRASYSAERDLVFDLRSPCDEIGSCHFGFDKPRGNRHRHDAVARARSGDRLCEIDERGFTRAVIRATQLSTMTSPRRNVDDAPTALLAHLGHDEPSEMRRAEHIDV